MKISLFVLISTLICLYFGQSTRNTSKSITFRNNVEQTTPSSMKESNGVVKLSEENDNNLSKNGDKKEMSDEETEAYLDFVRKQMQESIQEHLQNIQEKLGEHYDEKAEKLILM